MPDRSSDTQDDYRALSHLLGGIILLAMTVLLAAMVAVAASSVSLEAGGPTATVDGTAESERSVVTLEHNGGDTIDVTELTVYVEVNGDALAEQPPVPFVGADGFDGSPDGPFNTRADPAWHPGEQARVTLADTNDPTLEAGDTVTIELAVRDKQVTTLEMTAT